MAQNSQWISLGTVFDARRRSQWMHSHAANPIPLPLKADLYKIYFSTRDTDGKSRIGWVIIDMKNPTEVLRYSRTPEFELGVAGTFDERGASAGSIAQVGTKTFLYYAGWNLSPSVPFRNAIGAAVCSNPRTQKFARFADGPLLDRNRTDPFNLSYPFVFRKGRQWRMIYGSHAAWETKGYPMLHYLKYATSKDGLSWTPVSRLRGLERPGMYAYSRPTLIYLEGKAHLFYCQRGPHYTLGHATVGADYKCRTRKDLTQIYFGSPRQRKEKVVSYPYPFLHRNQLYLLYCGEKYGLAGFKIARADRK